MLEEELVAGLDADALVDDELVVVELVDGPLAVGLLEAGLVADGVLDADVGAELELPVAQFVGICMICPGKIFVTSAIWELAFSRLVSDTPCLTAILYNVSPG